MTGNSVTAELRLRVYRAASERCAACSKRAELEEMHCDHILPVAKGGLDNFENLRCLCLNCHKLRHGGRGYTKYDRRLDCGCVFSVWHRNAHADAPQVLSYLGIKSPRRTRLPMLTFHCRKHRKVPWSQWLELLNIELPEQIPVGSRADLSEFIHSANGGRIRTLRRG